MLGVRAHQDIPENREEEDTGKCPGKGCEEPPGVIAVLAQFEYGQGFPACFLNRLIMF